MSRLRRPVDPRAGSVLNKIEAIVEAVKTAEAAKAAKLPFLISQAHEYGVSYEAIGNRMGLSRQRVSQLERGQ